ncbi:MAG: hypothetical protein GY765_12505 [bacterium]|nr:hypothetical protein [bacterium]
MSSVEVECKFNPNSPNKNRKLKIKQKQPTGGPDHLPYQDSDNQRHKHEYPFSGKVDCIEISVLNKNTEMTAYPITLSEHIHPFHFDPGGIGDVTVDYTGDAIIINIPGSKPTWTLTIPAPEGDYTSEQKNNVTVGDGD